MILPIVAYGDPVLKRKADEISADYPELTKLIADMKETMYRASGVGLAAPQIGKSIRLFIIDSTLMVDEEDTEKGIQETFINALIIDESGREWAFEEGCLSIPGIREDVYRQPVIKVRYLNENFEPQEKTFEGMTARVIQHEYDHIEGILFTDRIKPLKKTLLKKKLQKISEGNVKVDYKMKFPK
jgi:peptide deformylase